MKKSKKSTQLKSEPEVEETEYNEVDINPLIFDYMVKKPLICLTKTVVEI